MKNALTAAVVYDREIKHNEKKFVYDEEKGALYIYYRMLRLTRVE